jgi:hypothetical protein
MTVLEQIDQIAAEARAKIDELVKLQKQDEPQPGDWCVFWGGNLSAFHASLNHVGIYKCKTSSGYNSHNNAWTWPNCRRITPEDFGWKLENRPDWKNAPDWANYLAQDANGGWWWYDDSLKSSVKSWLNGTRHAAAMAVFNWRETLERRPE